MFNSHCLFPYFRPMYNKKVAWASLSTQAKNWLVLRESNETWKLKCKKMPQHKKSPWMTDKWSSPSMNLRDGSSDSMSEELCTKGKRKLHSHCKQIIMDLKALPYGQSTQALFRPQVCPCLSRIPSPQLAASHFSTPALTQVFPKCNSSKLKSPHKPEPLLIHTSVHNCRLKLFLFVS